MTLIRLTDPNLTALKRALRAALPEVRTSHIAEALARALGRNTYAAVLAAVRNTGASNAPFARFDPHPFIARLAELGAVSSALDPVESAVRGLEWPEPCWAMVPDGDRAANDRWFIRCRAENLPTVWVRYRRRYATLAWDGISLDTRCDQALHGDVGAKLGKRMFETFQTRARGQRGRADYLGSAFVGSINGLEIEVARQLADDVFEMLFTITRTIKLVA